MAQLSRAVTAAVAILILLGPPAHVRGQDRKVLSPEVTKERRVVFRLQAPNPALALTPGTPVRFRAEDQRGALVITRIEAER